MTNADLRRLTGDPRNLAECPNCGHDWHPSGNAGSCAVVWMGKRCDCRSVRPRAWTVTAGNNSTDLGAVGHARTIAGARRVGRRAVLASLPNGEGSWTAWTEQHEPIAHEERSTRTGRSCHPPGLASGPVVNGERFAPGYTPEAADYEQRTRLAGAAS